MAMSSVLLLATWLLRDVSLLVFASVLLACALRLASHWFGRMAGTGRGPATPLARRLAPR